VGRGAGLVRNRDQGEMNGNTDCVRVVRRFRFVFSDYFTCAYSDMLQPGEAILVDDNGLLNSPVRFFKFAGYAQPLAGKGLILGSDAEGDTSAATSKLDTIKSAVMFADVRGNSLVQTNQPWVKKENAGG
jgi:hypothetical protein